MGELEMQATNVATTHPHAPYDLLAPMRCRFEFEGRSCSGRGADINWQTPDIHGFKCPKCKSFNVVVIVEKAS